MTAQQMFEKLEYGKQYPSEKHTLEYNKFIEKHSLLKCVIFNLKKKTIY